MAKMLTVDGTAIVTVLEADGGSRALVPVDIPAPPVAGPWTVLASGTLNVGAFGVASVGPFARTPGAALVGFFQPDAADIGAEWYPGNPIGGQYGCRMRNPGPSDQEIELVIQNASGTPRDFLWVIGVLEP